MAFGAPSMNEAKWPSAVPKRLMGPLIALVVIFAGLFAGVIFDQGKASAASDEKSTATATKAPTSESSTPQPPVGTEPAAASAKKSGRSPLSREPLMPSMGRIFFYLGVLSVALFGSIWMARRVMGKSRMVPSGDRCLKLVDAIPLGPRRQIYVLSAYGRRLVVGAAGDRMTLLSEFAPEDLAEPEAPAPFAERLEAAESQRTPKVLGDVR